MDIRESTLSLVEELIARLELQEPSSFRIQAYRRLAEVLAQVPERAWRSAETLIEAMTQHAGIGAGLQRVAQDLVTQGTTPLLEELREAIPDSLLELRALPGLGPKRIHQLWKEAGVTSVDALVQAIERGKIAKLSGWGPTLLKRLEEGIRFYRAQQSLFLYREGAARWERAVEPLRAEGATPYVVGELRRALPLLNQVEGILPSSHASMAEQKGWKRQAETVLRHPEEGVLLYLVEEERIGEALLMHTGPSAFWEALQVHLPLTRIGLTEEELFQSAGLPYILPAWRDWEDIIDLARRGKLPSPLTEGDIQGTLHVHTTFSDGIDSLEAMAEAAQQWGWKWLGIADHSQRAAYARGLSPETLQVQGQAIDQLNASFGESFRLLKGIEADILPDGSIDYDEKVWTSLDFIVASVHEKLRMTEEEATTRLLRALENPYVRVLGHWTGRLLRNRPGYPIDEEKVLKACANREIAIEFNANPYRMEIDWKWVRRAAELGVSIVLTTDAHAVGELSYWRQGLAVLQKGLLPPELLLNRNTEAPFPVKR